MFGRIHPVTPASPGLLFAGSFLFLFFITSLISLFMIGLFMIGLFMIGL